MLKVQDVHAQYGAIQALRGVSLEVDQGEIVALIGSNGAGKSTLLRLISGLKRASSGTIAFQGLRINDLRAEQIVRLGIRHAPEGRRVFARSTVLENLQIGAYTRNDAAAVREDLERLLTEFPVLRKRMSQPAGTLSGGEQQMLTIARALMGRPQLLMLDEPSLGLAPQLVNEIFRIVGDLHKQGTTILLVEQNSVKALAVADRAYVLENGCLVLSGSSSDLTRNEDIRRAYLGG